MKQQLKANQLRIELLETENINLRTMLQKISEANLFEKVLNISGCSSKNKTNVYSEAKFVVF